MKTDRIKEVKEKFPELTAKDLEIINSFLYKSDSEISLEYLDRIVSNYLSYIVIFRDIFSGDEKKRNTGWGKITFYVTKILKNILYKKYGINAFKHQMAFEDLVSNTVIGLLEKMGKYDLSCTLYTYIYYESLNPLKKFFKEINSSYALSEDHLYNLIDNPNNETHIIVFQKILIEYIIKEVNTIKKEDVKKVFSYYFLKGLKMKEISKIMKKSEGTIKTIINRTRNKLRKLNTSF